MFRRLAFLLLIMSLLLHAGGKSSAEKKPTEYEVKAAYIYNFAKFVEWPGNPPGKNSSLTVCVLGEDPFGPALAALEGKAVKNKQITVKHHPQNPANCDILFISGSEAGQLPQILEGLRGLPVLTIADTAGFAQRGVMINFYIDSQTVRFEINPKTAARAGLQISSKLFGIAKIVGAP